MSNAIGAGRQQMGRARSWAECRYIGLGWALCHRLPLMAGSGALNFGLTGVIAMAASVVWYALGGELTQAFRVASRRFW